MIQKIKNFFNIFKRTPAPEPLLPGEVFKAAYENGRDDGTTVGIQFERNRVLAILDMHKYNITTRASIPEESAAIAAARLQIHLGEEV